MPASETGSSIRLPPNSRLRWNQIAKRSAKIRVVDPGCLDAGCLNQFYYYLGFPSHFLHHDFRQNLAPDFLSGHWTAVASVKTGGQLAGKTQTASNAGCL